MRRRFLLVHNPVAGLEGRRLVDEVKAGLTHLGASVTDHDGAPEAVSGLLRTRAGEFDAAIAAGGDGTIRALAAQLEPHGLPLGIVPMGTGNVLAHELDLPRTAVGLTDLLLRGPVREFQGACANGEPFFLMAGVGFDGEVIRLLDTPLKRKVGKAAYTAPVLKTVREAAPTLEVEVDGTMHSAQWVVAANARCYGGPFVISPDAGLHREGLIAVLIQSPSRFAQVRQLLALATGRLHRARGVTMIACKAVKVRSAKPVASQIDGDAFGATPLDITAGGTRVRLIVPEAYAARIGPELEKD